MKSREVLRMYYQISHITADSNYSWVYLTDGRKFLFSKRLLHWEVELSGFNFFRIHKSHLVNMDRVHPATIVVTDKSTHVLVTGALLPVARRVKTEFLTQLNNGC
jgi:two-component system LytT family response regulator